MDDINLALDQAQQALEGLPQNVERNHALAHLRTTRMWAGRYGPLGPDPVPDEEATAD